MWLKKGNFISNTKALDKEDKEEVDAQDEIEEGIKIASNEIIHKEKENEEKILRNIAQRHE